MTHRDDGEGRTFRMRRHRFARVLKKTAALPGFRVNSVRLAAWLEAGELFSLTAREILRTRYRVEIGDYSYGECFRPGAFAPETSIGRYVSVAGAVRSFHRRRLMDREPIHPLFYNRNLGLVEFDSIPSSQLRIESGAWLGYGAIVLDSCTRIGLGAVVGAGAVLTREVPDFGVAVGNPARVIRHRFSPEVCSRLRESQWWELDPEELAVYLPRLQVPVEDEGELHPFLKGPLNAANVEDR